nr:PilZ domain-containing protein [Sphingomonas japonica]
MHKNREPRHPVRVTARMRVGNQWQDVAIRNVSSRGMMLAAETPPSAGEYIEIRKAMLVIVARAVWVRDGVFGIRTQDRIDLGELLEAGKAPPRTAAPQPSEERRSRPRTDETAQRNRERARQFQFVLALVAIVGVAAFLALQVAQLLDVPFAAVRGALGGS